MEIYVTDDRLGGYFRRYQLALRMMSHGARRQTVISWSGLTRDQLVTQRRRWGFEPDDRQRGPAPRAFHVFFKSRRHRSQAALFASICQLMGAMPPREGEHAVKRFPGLESGELLCEAIEAFQEWEPAADLDFERAVLLASGVAHAEQVRLRKCSDCHAATLVEGTWSGYANCGFCARLSSTETNRSAREKSDQRVICDHKHAKP